MDVFVLTRNSGRFLDRCLMSVKKDVGVRRLVVVDGGSTDGTLRIARCYGAEIVDDGGRGLGYARKLAAELCESEWLCFVDADVELSDGWHERMMRYATAEVGAIASFVQTIPVNDYERRITRIQNKRTPRRVDELKNRSARGFTGATLIRSRLLSGLEIPPIRCEEDYVITQHIIRQGYRWLRVPVFVNHWDRFSERPERITLTWATARFLHHMETGKFLYERILDITKGLLLSIVYREPLFFVYRVNYARCAIRGWFNWNEYVGKAYSQGWVKASGPSLNVGCGATKRYPFRDMECDVNCDFSVPEVEVPNYVRCDALNLPFRPIFSKLFASHLVEHLTDPDYAIKGFKAIVNQVYITVPSWFSTNAYLDPSHRWVWFGGNWRRIPKVLHFLVQFRLLRKIINKVSRFLRIPQQKTIIK